jgi:alkylhydroperoxidase family enzyme
MSFVRLSNNGSTPFERLLGHAPHILEQWNGLEGAFFNSSAFGDNFLEQVRRALAFTNQCQYCMAKAGPPDKNVGEARLLVALRFANKFALDHSTVSEQDVNYLKDYFSEAEIIELIAFCSFISASQRFGAVLGLQEAAKYNN